MRSQVGENSICREVQAARKGDDVGRRRVEVEPMSGCWLASGARRYGNGDGGVRVVWCVVV